MRKIITVQITALLLISGALGGMLFFTEIYDEVHSRIVLVLCLSCIKLEPKTVVDFTFETANGKPHPDFVLENLTKGPIFLHYSEDVCHGCDIMYPVIKQLFNVDFEKDEMFYKTVVFENTNVTHIYINIDHTTEEMRNSLYVYDKDNIRGLPMFTVVTLGYDHGIIKPYYATLYGTLLLDTDDDRIAFLTDIMQESIDVYKQNSEGYTPR